MLENGFVLSYMPHFSNKSSKGIRSNLEKFMILKIVTAKSDSSILRKGIKLIAYIVLIIVHNKFIGTALK